MPNFSPLDVLCSNSSALSSHLKFQPSMLPGIHHLWSVHGWCCLHEGVRLLTMGIWKPPSSTCNLTLYISTHQYLSLYLKVKRGAYWLGIEALQTQIFTQVFPSCPLSFWWSPGALWLRGNWTRMVHFTCSELEGRQTDALRYSQSEKISFMSAYTHLWYKWIRGFYIGRNSGYW